MAELKHKGYVPYKAKVSFAVTLKDKEDEQECAIVIQQIKTSKKPLKSQNKKDYKKRDVIISRKKSRLLHLKYFNGIIKQKSNKNQSH